ncbi:Ubiquitin carboxyl-terminal hydrolase 7 [Puccinia graminis f. sp. tritici]|uniref:Ubiquitin carboxyl-terminal hydrolase 7 n=1 Tax=Puccinia graminis f. sp. tritici TaxID=56615 RepID=A0A5B0QJ16_PUCGR|nr:Ubiquitin carboxyl-terminal hydrolase 7 [Puccinia graminis f. sp. tritici]
MLQDSIIRRTGGQFGAQENKKPTLNYEASKSLLPSNFPVERGQFGASMQDPAWEEEKHLSDEENDTMSDKETEIDENDPYVLDLPQDSCATLSERARKTLKQTLFLSKSYFTSSKPFLLRMSQKKKNITFSIELQTFASSKTVIVTAGGCAKKVLFLVQFHPHDSSDPTFNHLSELIEDLYIMSNHRSNLKNKNKISGRMSGIGFRGGYEKGKSAGSYAVRKDLKPSQLELETNLQNKLPRHNQFIADRFRHFSEEAVAKNKQAMKEFGIPSWSDEAWESYKNDPTPLCSNVIVTSNDFSNKPHCDKDKNIFTYGIFSYIDRSTGTPILPPSSTRGHGIRFPDYDCNINFGTTPGIIEVLWKSNDICHHTIGPPEELKSTKKSTHFGCSFQISHRLVARALKLKCLPEEEKKKRTMTREERSKKKVSKKKK